MLSKLKTDYSQIVSIDLVDDDNEFDTSAIPTQYNGMANFHKPTTIVNSKSTILNTEDKQNHSGLVIARVEGGKGWLEEMIEFSSTIARQTQTTLERIKTDFRHSGMKFDTNFRDHFLYIANNRLRESFDAFLIGLPKESKSNNLSINRIETPKTKSRRLDYNLPSPMCVPAKRPRLNDGTTTDSMTSQIVASHSNQSMSSLKREVEIGPEISVQKIVSTTTTATSSSLAMTKSSKSSSTTKEMQKLANNMQRSEIPIQQKDRKKSLENARNLTNFHMYLAENKLSSPTNPERRMTLGGSMIIQPKLHTKSDALNKSSAEINGTVKATTQQSQNERIEKTTPKRIHSRRMTVASKEFTSNARESRATTTQSPSKQSNETLPAARVTRSRSTHRIKKTYQCESCAYSNDSKSNYQRHLLVHTGEKPFKCKHCDGGYTQKIHLIKHLRRYHQELRSDPSYWDMN